MQRPLDRQLRLLSLLVLVRRRRLSLVFAQ